MTRNTDLIRVSNDFSDFANEVKKELQKEGIVVSKVEITSIITKVLNISKLTETISKESTHTKTSIKRVCKS